MKPLIVHPEYITAIFISPIYVNLKNKNVINGDITKPELHDLIESHYRRLILGNGFPYGLLSRGQFAEAGPYIIDESMVSK